MSRDESHDHYTITVSAGLGWAGMGWAGQTNWCGSEKTVSQHEPVLLLSRTPATLCLSSVVMVCYNRIMRVTATDRDCRV